MNDDNEDRFRYKREGHLQLKIDKFSEFARDEHGGVRRSEPVQVLGFQWKIFAIVKPGDRVNPESTQNYLGFFFGCNGNKEETTLSCTATATLKVLAQKQGKQDFVRKRDIDEYHVRGLGWELPQFMTFEKLMDPENGWYNEVDDSIVVTVDFEAGPPNVVSCSMALARKDAVLVNGKKVNVNKHHLAANSDYFERFFFGEGYKENNNIELELPATVEHFKRMIDTLHPYNRTLDDQCIEGVYHLANQFFLNEVEQKCRTFLTKESKHSAIFKYRLADKYGFNMLKKLILDLPKEEFSKEADFFENLEEYGKLGEPAWKALGTRIGQLFGKGKASDEEPPAKRARTST